MISIKVLQELISHSTYQLINETINCSKGGGKGCQTGFLIENGNVVSLTVIFYNTVIK